MYLSPTITVSLGQHFISAITKNYKKDCNGSTIEYLETCEKPNNIIAPKVISF